MAIFDQLDRFSDRIALISDDMGTLSYRDMLRAGDGFASAVSGRCLILAICRNEGACVAGYVGLLRAGAALLLVHHSTSAAQIGELIERYAPQFLFAPADHAGIAESSEAVAKLKGFALVRTPQSGPPQLHEDLSLLLTTSGTTGGRSLVRLSASNAVSNAEAIIRYVEMTEDDRAITTMPMSYSYGLSIIHSHLLAGAALILTEAPLVSTQFWTLVKDHKVTNFGGVPFIYEMLKKLRFERMDLPSLRYLTQAGGRLAPELIGEFVDICRRKGMKLLVMYGQTEAAPRIAYVPWEVAKEKAGTIGIAIPGGNLSLAGDDPSAPSELIYRGPNVFLGYATSVADLAKGDENQGVLYTGDVATRDADGFYTIVGRQKRFLKVYGHRVNLDEVEDILRSEGVKNACAGHDDRLEVYVPPPAKVEDVTRILTRRTAINPRGLAVIGIDAIPYSESGKVNYTMLRTLQRSQPC